MKYKAIVPFIPSMGTVAPIICSDIYYESKEEQALWAINSMRDHDGLCPLSGLPKGIKFERIYKD